MESIRGSAERPPRFRSEAGFSLVEMMIATAVAVVVGLGIYAIFNSQRKVTESQRIFNDLQTSCDFAMDQIKRELLLAGYRSQNPTNPVSVAGANAISFDYWDERAGADAPFDDAHYDRHTQAHFTLEANGDLVRRFKRWHTGSNAYEPASIPFANLDAPYKQLLAKGVQSLNFQYFLQNNAPWVSGTNRLADIRSVIVSLECQATRANPIYADASRGVVSDKYQKIRLQSEVRLRNIGVDANPRDTQPPATPGSLPGTGKGIRAWDPGLCSPAGTVCGAPGTACASLELAWDANTESDLAGYNLYYGLASNSYSNRVRIPRGPGAAGTRVAYTLTGLQATKACDAAQTTYFLRIEAFDKSGNPSGRSGEITGPRPPATVPVTNLRSEAAAIAANDSDTALNPTPPPAPTGLVARTPADNQIRLSWAAPAVAGLVGYRLYRSNTAGFTPAGRRVGDPDPAANILADETTLTADTLTYLDTGLAGCVPVYYLLAAITCDPCLPFGELAFAAVSASPTDSTKPPAPKLVARAGFQRVILSIENPIRAATPDFRETRVYFNAGSGSCTYPILADDGTVSNGRLIPDGGGIFTGEGTLPAINFDSEDIEHPATPSLVLNSSYCFLAVAFDRCNNPSKAEDTAKDVGQQCGDCMSVDNQPDPMCYGAPPAPGTIRTAGCSGSLELAWDHADPAVIRDFTGYRVYRCDNVSASPCPMTSELWSDPRWELLTGADPVWFSNFVDSPDKGLQEGHKYLYRILATDCYWEQHHGKSPWPDPANDPNDNAAESSPLKSLALGRIVRDSTFPQFLSGMMPNTTWTQYAIAPEFRHNTVLFRLMNTADATLSLKQATISWETAAALLQRIAYGDNSTTPVTSDAWVDLALPLTRSSGSPVAFKTGAEFLPLDVAIPVHLTFKRADGALDETVNLRENQMQVAISYRNESTGDESCSMLEKLPVPLGPYIYGTTQDMPDAGTMAWAVPGAEGANAMNAIIVPGQQMVNVHTNVSDSDFSGIREARLYYYVDAAKVYGSAPALDPGARYDQNAAVDNLAPYQRIALAPVAGNQWRTPPGNGIPASNDANVWFFIVAVDNSGNFDREPEPEGGAFQYFQRPYNVCYDTPGAPALTGSSTSNSISLSWTAPLQNTDGTSWTDKGGYRVYRKTQTSAPVQVAEVGSTTFTFTDSPPNMGAETYSYYVSAYDTCTPAANESSASTWFTECQGAPACTVNISSSHNPLWSGSPGDTFTINLCVCARQNGVAGEYLYAQACSGADANPVRLVEDGDSGSFQIDAGTYLGSEMKTWLTLPSSPGNLDLRVNSSDTITVRGYQSTAGGSWDSTCDTTLPCAAAVNVVGNPCVSPVRPAAPTNLTIAIDKNTTCKNGLSGPIGLAWTASATGPVSEYRIYRCIGAGCTPAQIGTSTTTSFTDPDAGASLKANVFTYEIRAVNRTCPSNPLESVGISDAETCN